MIHSHKATSTWLPRFPFRSYQDEVPKKRIKIVVTETFIKFRTDKKYSDIPTLEAMDRVTKKIFGKRTYRIAGQNGAASDGEIFTWFITGKHGPKLHRKAIVSLDMEVESFLRESGININHQDEKTADTPLILATQKHLPNLVKTLVTRGANLGAKNARGNDAIQEAIICADHTDYRNDSMHEIIKCLLKNGADVQQKSTNHSRYSLREYAIKKTEFRTAKLMIDHSTDGISNRVMADLIDTNYPDNADIIRYLYETNFFTGAERINNRKMTALMLACENQNQSYVTALLEQPGTELETTTILPILKDTFYFNKYHTAYSFAASQKGSQCAQILADRGARKIIPKLTSNEVKWVEDYQHAKNMRNSAFIFTGVMVAVSAGAAVAIGGLASGASMGHLENVKNRRPAPHLTTEPIIDEQEELASGLET